MKPATALLFASLLVPAVPAAATAQTQSPAASAGPPSEQPAPALARRPRAYTGLDIRFSASTDAAGVLTPDYPVIRGVRPGSPGEQAGLTAGDVIIEVNGGDSREQRALWLQAGVRYTLRVRTGDQEREVVLVPVLPPDPPSPPAS